MKWESIQQTKEVLIYPYIQFLGFFCHDSLEALAGFKFSHGLVSHRQGVIDFMFLKEELLKFEQVTREKLLNDSSFLIKAGEILQTANKNFSAWQVKMNNKGSKNLENIFLYDYYQGIFAHYGYSQAVSTYIDLIYNRLANTLKADFFSKWGKNYGEIYFNILAQPAEYSVVSLEEVDFYSLVKLLKDTVNNNRLPGESIFSISVFKSLIEDHIKKYDWSIFNYFGQDNYKELFVNKLKQAVGMDYKEIDKKIEANKSAREKLVNNQKYLLEKLNLPAEQSNLFSGLHLVSMLCQQKKFFTNNVLGSLKNISHNISLRLDLHPNYLNLLTTDEVQDALLNKVVFKRQFLESRYLRSFWQFNRQSIMQLKEEEINKILY